MTVGAKLRCGGSAAGATPSVEDVAAFITAAQTLGVPWKATAGLHHPVRAISRGTMMHGFLNLFIAAVALHAGALDAARSLWRQENSGHRIEVAAVAAARAQAVSFGSCSFDEPVNGLRELGLLS